MFPDEIETARLRLVRLCRENVSTTELYRHMRAGAPHMSEVSEYAMWDPHETPKDTDDFLSDTERQWDDYEQATYAIFLHPEESSDDDERLAGTTNLHFDWERRSAELGIWLRKPFWGRGYSGERAAAMLELAFDRLDLELVGASHQDGNVNSRRAIEKYVERFGGQYDGVLRNFVPQGGEVRDLHRYTVSQEQYRDATADET
ncbi:GNAT family N-acetyltransferase [Halorussus aquaticus]|uniref:GNAT family N-acetyltransferase n=1 Tax=Halorussus aquaticus TaxID=2953748 RepID=A0ABD5Q0C7_9EURY|nr:GNAT family protein [Halorussus aquaticus]